MVIRAHLYDKPNRRAAGRCYSKDSASLQRSDAAEMGKQTSSQQDPEKENLMNHCTQRKDVEEDVNSSVLVIVYGNAFSIVEGVPMWCFETLAIFSAHRLLKYSLPEGGTREKNWFFQGESWQQFTRLYFRTLKS